LPGAVHSAPMKRPFSRSATIPLVIVLGLLIGGAMLFSLFIGNRISERHAPLMDAAVEIKLEAALGHLWFEEVVGGDTNEEIASTWEHLDRSAWYARAMLEGGENSEGIFIPLRDPDLRREIEEVVTKIDHFRALAEQRWALAEESRAGTPIDQRFDAVFYDLLEQADAVEKGLQVAIRSDLLRFRIVQGLLIALCLVLTVLIAVAFRRYDRRQARSTMALRESEEHFRALFQKAPFGYQSLDGQGNFIEVNEKWCEVLGCTREDVLGRNFAEFLHPDFRPHFEKNFPNFKSMGYILGVEFEMVRKDGKGIVVSFDGRIGHEDDGSFKQTHCVLQDITELKRAEQEHERLEAQLRQAHRMEAVGQLAGGVAHDFNNLLQVILGYGEMALEDPVADGSQRTNIEEMVKAGERARTLVGQLLAFSRRQVLEMKDVDLNEVVAGLVKMMGRVIGEHITLDVFAGHDLGIVRADPGQIEQILMNLCVNARDAMPDGGTITIETENVRIDQAYCEDHAWARPGRFVLLSITDTGHGIDEKTMANVFEPFFTTKDVGEGTGLGLSTVYGLVKQHEGSVNVYSEVGKGTTVKIYLPVVERDAHTVGDKIEGPVVGGTETILLAEDDEKVRELTRGILEEAGYTVLAVADGEEALRVFEQHAGEIDLALLDVVMPRLGGRAVLERIRESHPEVAVLFASGYSANAIHTNFVLDEELALIQKPFQRDDLLRRVRGVLDEYAADRR
jgi:PAS domain S-box-containing protein